MNTITLCSRKYIHKKSLTLNLLWLAEETKPYIVDKTKLVRNQLQTENVNVLLLNIQYKRIGMSL